MKALTTVQCCRKGFEPSCACKPQCSAGECVHRPGCCPMHCGCAQHTEATS